MLVPSPPSLGIVFDAVGTLIYPDPAVEVVYHAAGKQYGSLKSVEQVAQDFRRAFRCVEEGDLASRLITSESRERIRWRQIVAAVFDDVDNTDACFETLFDHFARPSSWRLYRDAATMLETLHDGGWVVAIASNFDARLHSICESNALLSRCNAVVISSEVGYRKPHQAMFQTVEQRLGVPSDALLHVGDDLKTDYEGALIAGWHSVLLDRQSVAPSSVRSVLSLEELWTILEPA